MNDLKNAEKISKEIQTFLEEKDPGDSLLAMLNMLIYTLVYNHVSKQEFIKDIDHIWSEVEKEYKEEKENDQSNQ